MTSKREISAHSPPDSPRRYETHHRWSEDYSADIPSQNFPKNLELVDTITSLAKKKGVTASQLTLAWLLAQGDDVIP